MRVGLIGLGSIAEKVYLPLLGAHDRADLVGVASRTARTVERVRSRYRVPFGTTDYRELLGQGLDLAFVHTATDAHHEIVTACLDRGIPVYVDKPLSADLAEAEAMAGLAETRGLLLAVGFNRRFAPAYVQARDFAGPLAYAVIEKHRTALQAGTVRDTVYDDAIHILDTAVWLGGEELEHHRLTVSDGRLLTLTARTARTSVAMHRRSGFNSERLELLGDGRSAVVSELENLLLREDGTERLVRPESWHTIVRRRGFADLVDHVLDTVGKPAECQVNATRALPAHRLAERLLSEGAPSTTR
jgi:virulence factor